MWTLVTGASGFVGSHLVRAMIKTNVPVIAMQRIYKPIEGFPDQDTNNFRRLICDLREPVIPMNVAVSSIVHCAAQVVMPDIDAVQFAVGNITAAAGAIHMAREVGTTNIILMSSTSIYGGGNRVSLDEQSEIISPGPYGTSKYLVEQMFQGLADRAQITAIRTPGIIGKGANSNFLTKLVDKLRNDETLEITNPDAEFNHLVHVADVVKLCLHLIGTSEHVPRFVSINLASEKPKKILDIVRQCEEGIGRLGKKKLVVQDGLVPIISSNTLSSFDGFRPLSIHKAVEMYLREYV